LKTRTRLITGSSALKRDPGDLIPLFLVFSNTLLDLSPNSRVESSRDFENVITHCRFGEHFHACCWNLSVALLTGSGRQLPSFAEDQTAPHAARSSGNTDPPSLGFH